MFITLLGSRLESSGKISYANAGHTEALLWESGSQHCRRIPVTGMPIGITPDLDLSEKVFYLRPGDVLLFYSDGITEATNKSELMFGIAGWRRFSRCCR
jgi:sigma-B regulation protein RsbU (phosphoserine phosphatase)